MKKHRGLKIAGVAVSAIVVLSIAFNIIFPGIEWKMIKNTADYDKRILIWSDNTAGNSNRSKLGDMNIDYSVKNVLYATIRFASALVNDEYADREQIMDTFTYLYEIKGGFEKDTYEDEPYLIPYLAEGGDSAVIVIPGGGYGYKSMDGDTGEGKEIAKTLNANGINAFVLHYRSNPYEYPIPQLDLQRAVRFLRYHAEEYGLSTEKISLIGFSAGGNLIGSFINRIQGHDVFPGGYLTDEVDKEDDYAASAAMIYPALSYRFNVPMLFCAYDAEVVRDEKKRNELLNQTDLSRNFHSSHVIQFISYGTKDKMVGMDETKKYIAAAQARGTNIVVKEAVGQDHGYKQEYYMQEYLEWMKEIFKR